MTEVGTLLLGCDHAGFPLMQELARFLSERGTVFVDVGTGDAQTSTDYPDFAHRVASAVAGGEYTHGVLVCGTGVGMSIAANRHAGARAVVCSDVYTATMARKHNDANILCLGARVVGPGLAEQLVSTFLDTKFEGGRHERRVRKIEL